MPLKTTENSVLLPDKRTLSFAEYGDLNGEPVFYFHGCQESRLSCGFMAETARDLGIRIIAPERPGIGNSDFHPCRTFLDWARDVEALADSLSIEKFSIFGLAGGSPHVLSCLHLIPNRVLRSALIAGTTPYGYKGSLRGMWLPVRVLHGFAKFNNEELLRWAINLDKKALLNSPEKRLMQYQYYLTLPDKILMKNNPEYGWEFINGSLEAYKQGIDGVVQEWKMYVNDWGFSLSEIEKEVTLWYGTEDKMAPTYRGYYLNEMLPISRLKIIENEGYFSLIRNHLRSILLDLI